MMKYFFLFSFYLTGVIFLSGCQQGPLKPEGLPDLISGVQITVIQDGKPLEGADVTLVPLDTSLARWPVKGKTDAGGIAKLATYGKFSGCPAGKFKVVVSKREYLPNKGQAAADEVFQGVWKEELNYIDYVDPVFGLSEKTTLNVEIGNGSIQHTVDTGKAVKQEGKE